MKMRKIMINTKCLDINKKDNNNNWFKIQIKKELKYKIKKLKKQYKRQGFINHGILGTVMCNF